MTVKLYGAGVCLLSILTYSRKPAPAAAVMAQFRGRPTRAEGAIVSKQGQLG